MQNMSHTYVSFLDICHLFVQRKHVRIVSATFVWARVIWVGEVWLYWSVQRCTPMFSAGRRVSARRWRRLCAAVSIGYGGRTRAAWLPARPALLAARCHRHASAIPVKYKLTFPAYPLYITKFHYVSTLQYPLLARYENSKQKKMQKYFRSWVKQLLKLYFIILENPVLRTCVEHLFVYI